LIDNFIPFSWFGNPIFFVVNVKIRIWFVSFVKFKRFVRFEMFKGSMLSKGSMSSKGWNIFQKSASKLKKLRVFAPSCLRVKKML
jgi:hypothetical protein